MIATTHLHYHIAKNEAEFDDEFMDDSYIKEFLSREQKRHYLAAYSHFTEEIKEACARWHGYSEDDEIHCVEDWYPNCTCYLESTLLPVEEELILTLQSLLEGKFERWRILINFYESLDGDKPFV